MSEITEKLIYRGRPIVRCGDELYYGNMTDKFITLLKITSYKTVGDSKVADKVLVQLLYTDPDIKGKGKIVKSAEKEGLTMALEFADVWLSRNK